MAKKTNQRRNPYAFQSKKMEQQYQELRSRFRLTRNEFEQYYKDVRRANKKGQNLKRYGNALYRPRYSTEVGSIRNRQQFTQRKKSLAFVLSKEFRSAKNQELRLRFYGNLSYAYGTDAESVINIFKGFSDAEMTSWLKENSDLEIVYYDSDAQAVAMYLSTISMSAERFINRARK